MNWRDSLLNLLNSKCPRKGCVVEVGVHRGGTSERILGSAKQFQLLMVDVWGPYQHTTNDPCARQTREEFEDAYRRASAIAENHRATILRLPSLEACQKVEDESQDVVFIDACHEYKAVREDAPAWWRKLKTGGIMVFHDYNNTSEHTVGVKPAVDDFANSIGLTPMLLEPKMAWIQKP